MTMTQKPCPSLICFRVTRRCNAACSFCQAPNTSRAELTVDQIRILSRIFASAGVLSIKLSGGEPTVRPDLPDIIAAISAAGPKVVITTNGVRISDEVLDTAVRHSAEFKFSIHRPDMTNDAVLRVRSFERIIRNLASCRQRNIPFALNTVVTSRTTDLMDDMAGFALAQGARKISFIPVLPRGRAATSGQDGLDTKDLSLVRARVAALGRHYGGRIKVSCIDIRLRDYWVVENDGSLWIERSTEGLDVRVCGYEGLLRRGSSLVNMSL
jgi:MoaA/NifB/PqqE/SkfB family radical SAM enzyme